MENKIAIQMNILGDIPKEAKYSFDLQVRKALLQKQKKPVKKGQNEKLFTFKMLKRWVPIEPSYH